MNFESSALNFGEYDQEDVYLDVEIIKGGNSNWHKMSNPVDVYVLSVDTAKIEEKFSPTDYGHYEINWNYKASVEDQSPENNSRVIPFHVTDSVYSRSDETSELSWSYSKERYTEGALANEGHFVGSIFPIFGDCEVSSISTFITAGKADPLTSYRFTLWYVPLGQDDETPFELLNTEQIDLDSAAFNTWVTMPLDRDGESEFLKKGDLVYAGIQYWNMNEDFLVRRNQGLEIGTDNSVTLTDAVTIGIYDGNIDAGLESYPGRQNVMCRLNLNDHGNLIDGVGNVATEGFLGQNFPNPFRSSTEIAYELAADSEVTFEIMDITGRQVMQENQGMMPAGKHNFTLKTNALDAGIYFYTLKAGSFIQTRQMVITE